MLTALGVKRVRMRGLQAQRFAFVHHLKPISEVNYRKLSLSIYSTIYTGGREEDLCREVSINTNVKWASKSQVQEEQTLPLVRGS
jgi:hypothetical protein